ANAIPQQWVSEWERKGDLKRSDPKQRHRDFFEYRMPYSRGNRRWLYSKLLYEGKPEPRTRLRAATIRLIDAVFDAQNFGHHAVDIREEVPISLAITTCFAAVELCHHLAQDLSAGNAA